MAKCASPSFCASEHARSASGAQYIYACNITYFKLQQGKQKLALSSIIQFTYHYTHVVVCWMLLSKVGLYWFFKVLDIKSITISAGFKRFWYPVSTLLIFESDIRSTISFSNLSKTNAICLQMHQYRQFLKSLGNSMHPLSAWKTSKFREHSTSLINMVTITGKQLPTRAWQCVKQGTLSRLTKRNRRL